MWGDLTVRLGDWDLVARPAMGGALVGCRHKGVDILRPALDAGLVSETSAYPMVPFCGRIDRGRFEWDGKVVELSPNFPPETHAIHGTGWTSIWGAETTEDTLALSIFNDVGWWPFPFLAKQSFRAADRCLSLALSVTNTGETDMPAGLGWHPFFPAEGACVAATTEKMWNSAPGDAETRPLQPSPGQDISNPVDVDGLDLDHSFDWPGRWARLDYAGRAISLELSAGHGGDFLTVFHPPGADFICLEPLTHVPNALNMAHAPPMRRLRPGETLELKIQLTVLTQ